MKGVLLSDWGCVESQYNNNSIKFNPLSYCVASTAKVTVTDTTQKKKQNKYQLCEISSSRGGEYEAQNLLGCTAVFLIECRPTFQICVMEAARTSETSVNVQLRTRQYIPEDSELQI
jgi:hypothetical protein